MANVKRTVDIIFNGKDEVSKVVKGISGSVSQLDYVARNIADPLAGLGKSLLEAEGALVALTATGMALAIRESGKFGDSFNEISTLIHTTDENLDQFRSNILDYARDSKVSIDDINSAVYTAISAGTDYSKSLDVLTQSEKLSIAGRAELEPTTRLLAATLNAYGESTDAAQKYSDVFFTTVEKGLTTIPELANSLARVTGIAAAGKVPIETLMAAIAALTATGIPTEEAITGIRAAISNIISPSVEATKYSKELGIQFNAEALASKGLEGILREVYIATNGNVESIGKLFGNIRALNPALILGADNAGIFKGSLDAMKNSAGATEEAYRKMADNFAFINKNLANNIKATLIGLGDQLMDSYKDVIEGMGKIVKAIGDAIEEGAFDEIFDALDKFGDRFLDFFSDVAEALPEALSKVDYGDFINSLKELGEAFGGIFDDLDLTDPEDIAIAIQEIVNVITTLQYVITGMAEFFVDIFDALRDGARVMNDTNISAKEVFGQILAGAMMVQKAGLLVTAAFVSMKGSGVDFQKVFLTMVELAQIAFQGLIIAMDAGLAGAQVVAAALWIIVGAIRVLTLGMIDSVNDAHRSIGDFIKGANEDIKDRAGMIGDSIGKIAGGFEDVTDKSKEATQGANQFKEEVDAIPNTKIIEFAVSWQERLAQIEKEKMEQAFPKSKEVAILPKIDKASTAKATELIKRELPDYRLLEIEARIDETHFKEQTKRIESYLKYKAEVDIAEIQAAADITESAFNSINTTITDTGDLIGTLFGQIVDIPYAGSATRRLIEEQIKIENENRKEALRLQRELTEAQMEYFRVRSTAIERGQGLITVQCEGLKPHLEAILWEIVETAQVHTNMEFGEFLQGL